MLDDSGSDNDNDVEDDESGDSEDDVEDEIYRQVKIAARDDGFYIRDRRFDSIDDARLFIDRALARAGLKAER